MSYQYRTLNIVMMGTLILLSGCGGNNTVKPVSDAQESPKPILSADEDQEVPWRYGNPNKEGSDVHVLGAPAEEEVPEGEAITTEEDLAEAPDEASAADQTQAVMEFEPVVHFAYNQDILDEQAMLTIEFYTKKALEHPNARVKLLGHTDERGTPEYNLALGERRANAVKQAMMVFGLSPERIEVFSYGEEKPLDEGHDETAWAKNRRVEIVLY